MALKQKVLRAHYTALLWKLAHIPTASLLKSLDYCWKWNQNTKLYHLIIMAKNLLVYDTVTELISTLIPSALPSIRNFKSCRTQMIHVSEPLMRIWQIIPPKKVALKQKVLRAHYTTLTWKLAHIPTGSLLKLQDYSWKWNQNIKLYHLIAAKNLSVQDTVTELSCSCRWKTGCAQNVL